MSSDREERVNAALAEYLQAEERGPLPNRDEFLARHAGIADELSQFLNDRAHFLRWAAPVSAPPDATLTVNPPSQLSDFELLRELGRGGMAVVYEARQKSLNRRVALKVLSLAGSTSHDALNRFRREAEAAAKLRHPHIVPILVAGVEGGTSFFAMELVEGPSLSQVLRQTGVPPRETAEFVRWAEQLANVAEALQHAHDHGIIHRDVKPSNLLLASDGRLLVADFGLARITAAPELTRTGEWVGSPAYMSPEQISPEQNSLDHRTDVYSLGATLFECLTGRPPFTGDSAEQVLSRILHNEPPPPRQLNPHVPADLEAICLHALEKSASARYDTAREFADDLRRFVAGETPRARRLHRMARWVRKARRQRLVTWTFLVALSMAVLATYFARETRRTRATLLTTQRQDALDDALLAALNGDSSAAGEAIARAERFEAAPEHLAFLRGQSAYFRGEFSEAIQHLEQAVAGLPSSVAAQSLFAAACVAGGRWEDYERTLTEVERMTPVTADDHLMKGLAEAYLDPQRGLKSLDAAVQLRNWPIARMIRAEVRSRLAQDRDDIAQIRQAQEEADLAAQLLPDNSAALLVALGTHRDAAGLFSAAGLVNEQQTALQQAELAARKLERFTHLPLVVSSRALFLQVIGREQESLATLQAARQTNDPIIAYDLALALARHGRPVEALTVLEDAQRLTGNAAWLRVWLLWEHPDRHDQADAALREIAAREATGLELLFRPCLRLLLGDSDEAFAESRTFQDRPSAVPKFRSQFYRELLTYNCGLATEQALLDAAGQSNWDRSEAHFFIALHHLADGNRDAARQHFESCLARRCYGTQAWDWSAVALARLKAKPTWPEWIRAVQRR